MENTRIHFRWKLVLIPVILFLILYLMFKVPNTVGTLVGGILFYLILDPIVEKLDRRFHARALWTFVAVLSAILIITLLVLTINVILSLEIPNFIKSFPMYLETFKSFAKFLDAKFSFMTGPAGNGSTGIVHRLASRMFSAQSLESFLSGSTQALFKIMAISFDLVMSLIIAVYLILDEKRIINFIEDHLSRKLITVNKEMWRDMKSAVSGYFLGLLILGLILFVASWAYLSFMRVNYAFLLSVWAGISIIIPYIGPFVGSLPPVAVALTQGVWPGIYAILFFTILQFLVTSVLSPKVIGEIIGVHPILVILALLVGGELGGMVGMIVAVPITSIVLIFLKYYWPMFLED
jgi:predicted PurR-regulated permease PerM